MSIDRSKGVQWAMDFTPEFPQIPVTILESPEDMNGLPRVLYNGPFNEDIVTALAPYGYVYNYSNVPPNEQTAEEDPFLLYSTNPTPTELVIVAGNVSVSEEIGVTFESDEYQYKLLFNPNVMGAVTSACKVISIEEDRFALLPLEQPYNGMCTALKCHMVNAVTVPVPAGPDIILISNPTEADFGANIGVPEGVTTTLNGPAGGATEIEGGIGICLSPIQPVTAAIQETTTQCVKMEGLFAVEINGEMVPYHFSETDLPRYFNSTNEHGVQFLSCAIECVPAGFDVSPLPTSIDGGWKIDYSIDGGPKQSWSQIDRAMTYYRDLLMAMLYGIFDPEATDVKLTDGGGGTAHFQIRNSSLQGARGGPGDQSHKVTFYRQAIDPGEAYTDLYDYFFSDVVANQFDIISCGLEDFPGY